MWAAWNEQRDLFAQLQMLQYLGEYFEGLFTQHAGPPEPPANLTDMVNENLQLGIPAPATVLLNQDGSRWQPSKISGSTPQWVVRDYASAVGVERTNPYNGVKVVEGDQTRFGRRAYGRPEAGWEDSGSVYKWDEASGMWRYHNDLDLDNDGFEDFNDSDGDGVSDFDEVTKYGTDPFGENSSEEFDAGYERMKQKLAGMSPAQRERWIKRQAKIYARKKEREQRREERKNHRREGPDGGNGSSKDGIAAWTEWRMNRWPISFSIEPSTRVGDVIYSAGDIGIL